MKKSNVYFFTANKKIDILKELQNFTYHDNNLFVCYGTGSKAFKQAMKQVKPEEIVYQIKQTINKTEIIYKY